MLRVIFLLIIIFGVQTDIFGQSPDDDTKLKFNGDFRFRLEQDWNSRKSDGSFRDDRSRMRYRLRAGLSYSEDWYTTGFQLRTGNPIKQQDPQLTLGDGFEEFSTVPVGLDKLYFQGKYNKVKFWLGKNAFPFQKSNELYWSDNVNPAGIFISKGIHFENDVIDSLDFRVGHFVISTSNESFTNDAYFQGVQLYTEYLNGRIQVFPSIYLLKNIPNIPDGNATFLQDYKILHVGSVFNLLESRKLIFELEYSRNVANYDSQDLIRSEFKDQKNGFVVGIQYNQMKQKRDWFLKLSYAYLEQYAALDYMAQNDWARWDYSAYESPDGRLTNLEGVEFVAAYQLDKKVSLKMKYYKVNQLVPYQIDRETGDRIRFDIDARF